MNRRFFLILFGIPVPALRRFFLIIFGVFVGAGAMAQLQSHTYVTAGEKYLGHTWAPLTAESFGRFKKDGNRVEYEGQVFERRRQLAMLAMAEITERNGRFITDIVAGVDSMLAEPWWGIPAHYRYNAPRHSFQEVDLFNAESAALIAWTGKMLAESLEKAEPGITQKIAQEINHRILKPALAGKYWWKTAGMNWNPWICSNWLACVMLYEKDADRRQQAVTEIEKCMKAFIDSYPDDGGCDEGAGYWDRAAASLFECLNTLKEMRDAHLANVTMLDYKPEKVARMGAYIYNVYVGNDYCVTFADAHENRNMVQLNVLYPFALYLDDPTMRSFAAYIAKKSSFWDDPAALYAKSGNFPTLGRELLLLKNIDRLAHETALEPSNEAWLPDLQIKTMRTDGMFFAMKGGHNDESHNHNDIGSFVLFAGGKPQIIDCGVGEYTSKTFSKDRYSIWTMQSDYHNCPQINGRQQLNGKQYRAKVVSESADALCLDIAGAYPKEAGVKSWLRTAKKTRHGITITEDYSLDTLTQPAILHLLTTSRPDITKKGRIILATTTENGKSNLGTTTDNGKSNLGTTMIKYPAKAVTVTTEDLSDRLDPVLKGMWGSTLYRITMQITSPATTNNLTWHLIKQ